MAVPSSLIVFMRISVVYLQVFIAQIRENDNYRGRELIRIMTLCREENY